ncbi:DUF4262 domain-containing protein [Kitasatospora sp. NPDC001540]|uniref:DUF4262 domain-containing protein n=1 Tax=Kitasatospora sp. NPDC001540 TaxID=3364014 RepID=UPI0036880D6E
MHSEPPACRCVICHDYGDRDRADRIDRSTNVHIGEHGWSVIMVPADEEGPGFAYTVGLWHTHRRPELAMFGLDVQAMRAMLNLLGARAAAGEPLVAGRAYGDVVEGRPVVLRDVDRGWYREFLGMVIAHYRHPPVPVLQVLWPDADGAFPWQPESGEPYRAQQPQLWLPPAEHPAGVWTALLER